MKDSTRLQRHWDKVFFSVASIYFLLMLGWLVGQDKLKLSFMKTSEVNPAVSPPSAADQAFISYLQARLAMIPVPADTDSENLPKPLKSPEKLPSVAISAPPTPPKPTSPSVIERVYIPLYPEIPATLQPPKPPTPPQARPQPQPIAKISPIPAQKAVLPPPPPPSISPVKVNSVPVLNPRTNVTPVNPVNPSAIAATSPPLYRLVGALADGDRSYAIFSIKGKPQQMRIGQTIGQSGWVLVAVNNQQITLQKNGKQKIIAVGDDL